MAATDRSPHDARDDSQNLDLCRDMKRLISELDVEIGQSETSDPDEDELEELSPLRGSDLFKAVQAVQRYYPHSKLPYRVRQAWRGMLQRADNLKGEEDLQERYKRYYDLCNELFEWATKEVEQLQVLESQQSDNSRKAEPANTNSKRAIKLPKRSRTRDELDEAIRKYKVDRASNYRDLVAGVKKGNRGAVESARKMFGRNAVASALNVRSPSMVSQSPVWQEIRDELGLDKQKHGHKKTGYSAALENQAVSNFREKEIADLVAEQQHDRTDKAPSRP